MSNWTSGYVADIGYTYGYYHELNPAMAQFALTCSGYASPAVQHACELGFGQGLSINIHASAGIASWWGTDFNPAQAAFAQELSYNAGLDTHLFDASFAEFCIKDNLPEFDYIGLHGIWSWISNANRQCIVDFLRAKLKVGGILYISYNTQPGWAAAIPMRNLMADHIERMSPKGSGIITQINEAIAFTEKLFATNPLYLPANPNMADRFKKLVTQDRHYLAHEYFNADWLPMSFSQMAKCLSAAKLNYVCSANLLENIDAVNLSADQQAFMAQITDPVFKETVRDFMVNQQFRKDIWVKGPRALSVIERSELLRAQRIILLKNPAEIALKLNTRAGEVTFQDAIYKPIINALADLQPKSLGQLELLLKDSQIVLAQIIQASQILIGIGGAMVAQDPILVSKVKKASDKLNLQIMSKSKGAGDLNVVASPVTGGGYMLNRASQHFVQAIQAGKKLPAEWAQYAYGILQLQGQKLIKEGKTLETDEENSAEFTRLAYQFSQERLLVLKGLQII